MKKRFIAVVLVIILIPVFLMAACGQNSSGENAGEPAQTGDTQEIANFNPTGWPVVKDQITLKVVAKTDSDFKKPYNELELVKQWEEKTNVKIEWTTFDSASWNEKKNLMLVSGDLPDVIFGPITAFDELTYAAQGYWKPLQDLISKYTVNLKSFSEMYPDIYKSFVTPDGNIYSLPRLKGQEDMEYPNRMFINKAWLDKLALPMPTNIEEFYNVLKAFKTGDPNGNGKADEIPMAFRFNEKQQDRSGTGEFRYGLYGFFGTFGRFDAPDHIVLENDKVIFTADKDEYKNAVSWMRKAKEEGLIDPEAFTMDVPAFKAKNTSGDTLYGTWMGWTVEEATNPPEEGIKNYAMLPPLKNTSGKQIWPKFGYNVATKGFFLMTKNNKYPEATIRWIDYFCDPYVSIEHDWGIQGLGSKINSDGSWEILGGGLKSTRTAEGLAWNAPTFVPKHIYDK